MSLCLGFFRFVAKAAMDCVGLGIAGDFVAEVVPDMARRVHGWWCHGRPPEQVRAEAAAVAGLSDEETRRLVEQAIHLELIDQPAPVKQRVAAYLSQVPATLRQTQCRGGLALTTPFQITALLPARLPRFKRGDRPGGFPDWELDELLGVGGFGEVWRATNPHLPPVALKFCLDPAAARSLRNEAALLGRVVRQGRHPGFVALLDTALSTDPPCLKYEYVEGGCLAELVRPEGAPAQRLVRSLPILRELAATLAFAHRLSPPIVHRDLKPANVLRQQGPDGQWRLKVADLGIGASVASAGPETVATYQATALRGACTPLYASPQQRRGEDADPRDDVFSLGVIWYQLLTGSLADRPETDWRDELPGLPDRVLTLLGRCLAVRTERRLPDARALLAELQRLDRPDVAAEEEDEQENETDDLVTRLQRTLARAQANLTRARERAEVHHDYAGAVKLLERMPEPFRDNDFLEAMCDRRDRVVRLRARIENDGKACKFAGLADCIDEYLSLVPTDEGVRELAKVVPYRPGPEVVNSPGMRLVLLPAGAFNMGSSEGEIGRHPSEGPARRVKIAKAFYLGACPVTQEQYQRVMGVNPSHFRQVPGHDARRFPVEMVSWEDAAEFCRRLSALPEEQARGRTYRLPTEAEWEYACRAGEDHAPFSFGNSLSSAQANFDGRHPYGSATKGTFLKRTTAVGSYPANALGLHDMHGNVWEWCDDWFDENYYRSAPDRSPRGPGRGTAKVIRGGSWQNHARLCRSAAREWGPPTSRAMNIGFRVMLEVRATCLPGAAAPGY